MSAFSHLATVAVALFAVIGCSPEEVAGPSGEQIPSEPALSIEGAPPGAAVLGRAIFFDEDLSLNRDQSCASCHAPEWGWTGPSSTVNAHGAVYEGSIPGAFGNRRPPTASYATLSPILHIEMEGDDALFVGGNFWDGRATGEVLGNPAADQAIGPFLNPAEQALPSSACVVYRVCTGSYATSFDDVWGAGACPDAADWPADIDDDCAGGVAPVLDTELEQAVEEAYGRVGLSAAAFEDSEEVNAFSSKYDAFVQGEAKLSKLERQGFAIFKGKGKCDLCHVIGRGQDHRDPEASLFTDFTYDNLGVPKNPENPQGLGFTDPGLGGFLATRPEFASYAAENMGKQKVPTLRNVDLRPTVADVKAYAHNGYFKTLEGIVHFYNTRDVKPECPGPYAEAQALAAGCWPAPEVADNVNRDELGDLKLTSKQEEALVAFLRTLSDGWR
jgi:cytochrome c peroxidase